MRELPMSIFAIREKSSSLNYARFAPAKSISKNLHAFLFRFFRLKNLSAKKFLSNPAFFVRLTIFANDFVSLQPSSNWVAIAILIPNRPPSSSQGEPRFNDATAFGDFVKAIQVPSW